MIAGGPYECPGSPFECGCPDRAECGRRRAEVDRMRDMDQHLARAVVRRRGRK